MKKNSFFFIFYIFFLLFFSGYNLFATESKGIERCRELEILLKKNGFAPKALPIIANDTESYAYNILIDINDLSYKEYIKHLYFVFELESAMENFNFISKIMNSFSISNFESEIHFLFCYGDDVQYFQETTLTGTKSFVNSISNEENSAVICVGFADSFNSIITGSNGRTSPAWLMKLVTDAFFYNKLFYLSQGGFTNAFYRLNLLKNDYQTGLFLSANIPAAGIKLAKNVNKDTETKFADFFDYISTNFDVITEFEWDNHAQPIQIANKTYIIPEKITLIITLITAAISLFILCEFSFLIRFSHSSISKEILQSWPLIFILLIITAAGFMTGQFFAWIFYTLVNIDFFMQFAIKVFTGFAVISYFYFFILRFSKNNSTKTYDFMLSVISIANILIFSSVDLSFFYFFVIEYLLIHIFRPMKKTFSLSVAFICLSIPYIPVFIQLILYIDPDKIKSLVLCKPLENLLISSAFLPFEFIWFRILIYLNNMWLKVEKTKRNYIKQNLIAISSAVGIFAITTLLIAIFIPSQYKIKTSTDSKKVFESRTNDMINITSHDENYFGNIIRYVTIELSNQAKNLQVYISGTSSNSVLYSEYNYVSDFINHIDYFNMPLWPPKKIELHYIISSNQDSSITVYANFPENNENVLIKRTMELKQRSGEAE